jgi:enoyl-CoA hydratase/carnithine racemase
MYSEVADRVATVVLNRPQVLNCANEQWARDLNTLIAELMADTSIRVVVVRGEGRAFCTGIDVTALSSGEISMDFFRNWETALRKLESLEAIVVCAIHSHCIGGGLQLALACDLRIARDDARFGVTAVKEGIIPGIGMWRIARYAGLGRAKRLALTAEVVDASTAYSWGLIDRVTDSASFETAIEETTQRLLAMAWTSTRLTKRLTNMAFDKPFAEFADTYFGFQEIAMASPEHARAMKEHRRAHTQRSRPASS